MTSIFSVPSSRAAVMMLSLALCSCASRPGAVQNTSPPPLLSAPEMAAIQFKSGSPLAGQTLESALGEPAFFLRSLQRDVEVIKRYPQAEFEIIGFTDSGECSSTTHCQSLSKDRAQAVYDWLLSKGVASSSLKNPVGRGSSMPLEIGDTAEGRAKNRRVEINLSPE